MNSDRLSSAVGCGNTEYYFSDDWFRTESTNNLDQQIPSQKPFPSQNSTPISSDNPIVYPRTASYPTQMPVSRQLTTSESSLLTQPPRNIPYIAGSQYLAPPQSPKSQRNLVLPDPTGGPAPVDRLMTLDSQLPRSKNNAWMVQGFEGMQSAAPDEPLVRQGYLSNMVPPATSTSAQPHTSSVDFQFPQAHFPVPSTSYSQPPTLKVQPSAQLPPHALYMRAPAPHPYANAEPIARTASKSRNRTSYASGSLVGIGPEARTHHLSSLSTAQTQTTVGYPVTAHPAETYYDGSVQIDSGSVGTSTSTLIRGEDRAIRAKQEQPRIKGARPLSLTHSKPNLPVRTSPTPRPNLSTSIPWNEKSRASVAIQQSRIRTRPTVHHTPLLTRAINHSVYVASRQSNASGLSTPRSPAVSHIPSSSQDVQSSQSTPYPPTPSPSRRAHVTQSPSYYISTIHISKLGTHGATATQSRSPAASGPIIEPQQQPPAEIAPATPQRLGLTRVAPTPEPRQPIPSNEIPQGPKASWPNAKPRVPFVALPSAAGRQHVRSRLSQPLQMPAVRTSPPINDITATLDGGVAMNHDSLKAPSIKHTGLWLNHSVDTQPMTSAKLQVQSLDQYNEADIFPVQFHDKVEGPALREDNNVFTPPILSPSSPSTISQEYGHIPAPNLSPTLRRRQPSQQRPVQQRIQSDQIYHQPSTPDEQPVALIQSNSDKCDQSNRAQHMPQVPIQSIVSATEQTSVGGPKAKRARSHGEWDNTPHKGKKRKISANNSNKVALQMINPTQTGRPQSLSTASLDPVYFNANAWREGGSDHQNTRTDVVAGKITGANNQVIGAQTGNIGSTEYPPSDSTRIQACHWNPVKLAASRMPSAGHTIHDGDHGSGALSPSTTQYPELQQSDIADSSITQSFRSYGSEPWNWLPGAFSERLVQIGSSNNTQQPNLF